MKQVLIKKGSAVVSEVPAPSVESGEVLVEVKASCLSVGTEMSGLRSSALPIWKKALQQPEKVVTTLKMAKTKGMKRTWELVQEKMDAAHPTGYSASGIVVEVGNSIKDLVPGVRVACAGSQYAHHAEFICVSENLCVPLPENLDWESAATVTLGSIALQGVRRAKPSLGETFAVIGLGILGQLSTQILKVNGCRVIGIDLDRERISIAQNFGMDHGHHPEDTDLNQVARITNGYGVDGVIITAATPSDEVISSAFRMCRKKGRVVLVGDVGLNLIREDFYEKEIDLLISTSYGPGRYENNYEEHGLDYPISYVRWTENRNMAEYLRLLAEEKVRVDPLISDRYPIEEAKAAYSALDGVVTPLVVLLTYNDKSKEKPRRTVITCVKGKTIQGGIQLAVIGAGGFACSTHLPNLRELGDQFNLRAVVNKTGPSASSVAKQFNAEYASTDYREILKDPEIDAVIIATRHNLHATMVLESLKAGKHVLVEKPMVLNSKELKILNKFIKDNQGKEMPILMTGYNRRFSPYAVRMAKLIKDRTAPFIINYRMNVGYIPNDHWTQGPEGGGRNIGEACHIYDLFTFLTGSEVKDVLANSIMLRTNYYVRNDNFVLNLSFADGSVASLTYTALGSKDYPKEMAELYVDGKMAVLDDYKRLTTHGTKKFNLKTASQQKGLKEELQAFADGIFGGEWPIPWWQQSQSVQIALEVEDQINKGIDSLH